MKVALRRFFINFDYSSIIVSIVFILLVYRFIDDKYWVPIITRTLQWAPAAMISLLGFALTAWAIAISLFDRGRVSAFKKDPGSWAKLSNSFRITAILALMTAVYSAFIDGTGPDTEPVINKSAYIVLLFFEVAVFLQVFKVVHLLHRVAIAAVLPAK